MRRVEYHVTIVKLHDGQPVEVTTQKVREFVHDPSIPQNRAGRKSFAEITRRTEQERILLEEFQRARQALLNATVYARQYKLLGPRVEAALELVVDLIAAVEHPKPKKQAKVEGVAHQQKEIQKVEKKGKRQRRAA